LRAITWLWKLSCFIIKFITVVHAFARNLWHFRCCHKTTRQQIPLMYTLSICIPLIMQLVLNSQTKVWYSIAWLRQKETGNSIFHREPSIYCFIKYLVFVRFFPSLTFAHYFFISISWMAVYEHLKVFVCSSMFAFQKGKLSFIALRRVERWIERASSKWKMCTFSP
jgi:hypothetical protein